jgi:hypothetical protein
MFVESQHVEIVPADDTRGTPGSANAVSPYLRDVRRHQPLLDTTRFVKLLLVGEIRTALGSSQNGTHAPQQLTNGKRLRDVVIGPRLESLNAMSFLVLGRKYEYGRRQTVTTKL